jgi:hypothetical protein
MLTGLPALEQTDWSRLHHAYGRATDTPRHLRALLEADPSGREEAMGHLWSAIIHQGTPWTATGPVALVVAGLLLDGRLDRGPTPPRANLVRFLAAVAEVFEQSGTTVEALEASEKSVDLEPLIDAGDDEALYGGEAGEAFFARALLGCVRASPAILDAMRAGLDHPDAAVRARAAMGAAALAKRAMRDRAPQLVSRLIEMARAEPEPDHQAALVLTLGELEAPPAALLKAPAPGVRVCAALSPMMVGNEAATGVLLDAFNHHAKEIDGYFRDRPPQFDMHPRFYVIARLVEVVRDFDRLLPGAVAVLDVATKHTVDRDWGPLLAAAFPAGDGVVRTDAQRRFLRAIVEHDPLWDRAYANPIPWFRKAGFTYDRRACRRAL